MSRFLFPPFPYSTFIINISGAFLIGIVYALGTERGFLSADVRIGILVGFLGGYTTFSSYCLELARLLEESEYFYALLYFTLSSFLGVLATIVGLHLARRVF